MKYAALIAGFFIGSVIAQAGIHHHYRVAAALFVLAAVGWVCGYCSAESERRSS